MSKFPIHPIKGDQRYAIRLEWCGYPEPRHVVRFCDDWIGQSISYSSAIMLAVGHDQRRKGALVIEEQKP